MTEINIRQLSEAEINEGQQFLFSMVESLFHIKRDKNMHRDIFELETFYLKTSGHVLLGAFDKSDKLIGTIALKTFIDRFEKLKGRYLEKTAEVGRCYILQEHRRKGIGSKLLVEAMARAKEEGYSMLYLHTHPNLPGGYQFWEKSGFQKTLIEEGTPDTIHMEMAL